MHIFLRMLIEETGDSEVQDQRKLLRNRSYVDKEMTTEKEKKRFYMEEAAYVDLGLPITVS